MRSKSRDLIHGNLWKEIILFSLPLMASNVLQIVFNMADIAVVGQFAGSVSLGAVGSTAILISLFGGLLFGLGGGVNVIIAQALGEGDGEGAARSTHTGLLISLIYGVILAVLGLIVSRPVLTLMQTREEFMDRALLYFRIYVTGMPAMTVYNFGNAVWSAAGNTKKPLLYLSCAGVLNVLLNLFFVLVLRMDVAGVALASVISQVISGFLIARSLFRVRESWGLTLKGLHIHLPTAKKLLGLALPTGFQCSIFAIANLFVQAGINSFPAVMVSGNTAASNADGLVYDVMAAFYTACASFMGQNYGAGNEKRVRKSYLITMLYSFIAGAVLGLGILLNGRAFLSLFSHEPEVIEAGMLKLSVMGWSYMFSAFMDNTTAACRALGRTLVPTVSVIMGSCVFRIIWIMTIFRYFHTIQSLYLLYIFSWSLTALFLIIYFIRLYRGIFPQAALRGRGMESTA